MRRASYQVETYNNKERRRISGERRGQRRCSQRLNLFTPQAEGSSSDNVAYAFWSIFLEGDLGVFARRVLLEVGEAKRQEAQWAIQPRISYFWVLLRPFHHKNAPRERVLLYRCKVQGLGTVTAVLPGTRLCTELEVRRYPLSPVWRLRGTRLRLQRRPRLYRRAGLREPPRHILVYFSSARGAQPLRESSRWNGTPLWNVIFLGRLVFRGLTHLTYGVLYRWLSPRFKPGFLSVRCQSCPQLRTR